MTEPNIVELLRKPCKLDMESVNAEGITYIGTCLHCGAKKKLTVCKARDTFHCFACGRGGHSKAAKELLAEKGVTDADDSRVG